MIWIVHSLEVYLAFGILFALAFVTRGVGAIDPAAKEGSWGFRVLILPGVVALWPVFARRWAQSGKAEARR